MLELEALTQTTQALTFRVQKKWDLELKQLWFGFCKTQPTFFFFPRIARLKPQSENYSECVKTAHAKKNNCYSATSLCAVLTYGILER